MSKTEIIAAAKISFSNFSEYCKTVPESAFFKRPENKWSVAENLQHLVISTNTTTLAYALPKFIVQWIAGKPNRNSRSYEETKNKYYKKLEEGGTASSRFVPRPIEINYGKQKLLDNWNKATAKFINKLTKNRTEKDLDSYLVKHPLLGRITLRELCYFTIFHTEHHLQSIRKISTE